MILDFTPPKKAQSSADHANSYGFDGGPPGGFVPNVARSDLRKFRAKHFNKGKENARIEIKHSDRNSTQIALVVGLDGWDYAGDNRETPKIGQTIQMSHTKGLNVRMSANGSMRFTIEEWLMLTGAVQEAYDLLQATKP